MRGSIPSRRKAITSAIILATMSIAAAQNAAAQDDPEVEEVVVTGSYIRGTPLDAPSPVQVVNRDSIEAQGAAVIWESAPGALAKPGLAMTARLQAAPTSTFATSGRTRR